MIRILDGARCVDVGAVITSNRPGYFDALSRLRISRLPGPGEMYFGAGALLMPCIWTRYVHTQEGGPPENATLCTLLCSCLQLICQFSECDELACSAKLHMFPQSEAIPLVIIWHGERVKGSGYSRHEMKGLERFSAGWSLFDFRHRNTHAEEGMRAYTPPQDNFYAAEACRRKQSLSFRYTIKAMQRFLFLFDSFVCTSKN